eukprot:1435912-Lingulodinium_polyedra.AAC.1
MAQGMAARGVVSFMAKDYSAKGVWRPNDESDEPDRESLFGETFQKRGWGIFFERLRSFTRSKH